MLMWRGRSQRSVSVFSFAVFAANTLSFVVLAEEQATPVGDSHAPLVDDGADLDDIAWRGYHDAFRLLLEGEKADSLSILRLLVQRYPTHPSAPMAAQVLQLLETRPVGVTAATTAVPPDPTGPAATAPWQSYHAVFVALAQGLAPIDARARLRQIATVWPSSAAARRSQSLADIAAPSPKPLPLPLQPEFKEPPATIEPTPATRVGDLSGWITAGVLWGALVHPAYRATRDAGPTTAGSTISTPGFFVGLLPGRGSVAGGALFTYRKKAGFADGGYTGGDVGLWYVDFQGHVLPKRTWPLSLYGAFHMGSLSWTAPQSGYSSSEFTAGLGLGIRLAPIPHVAVLGEYRMTGLFEGTESYSCGGDTCTQTGSTDSSKYMHLFTLGVACSYF
jgi:hypothetical protein